MNFYQRSDLFNDQEKATILLADQITRGAATIREDLLKELRQFYSEDQIVELTMICCVANFTNRFNDALQSQPDLE